jgi:hypothetical protein
MPHREQTTEVAHVCQHCGLDLRSSDIARRKSFAVKPDEPVASFALISTIMPRGASGHRPQTYRIALAVALTVALLAAIFGAVPIAVLVAAFAVPIVYIVYLYDVNLWEDEPLPVTVAAFIGTGILSLLFTIGWTQLQASPARMTGFEGEVGGGPQVGQLLLAGVLVPIVAHLLIQLGPVYLASRPKFDDLMDGFTFGVISGVAYSTFDTLVRHQDALFGGMASGGNEIDWVALIFLEGLIKPLIFGTAAGIAGAEFSGLGAGYDGFTPRYFRGLAEAIVATVAFQTGAYLLSFLPSTQGLVLTLLWGLMILGVLVLRVRSVLHAGLMEAALEQAARSHSAIGPTGELRFCAACEMPLVAGASFCNACGTAVRTSQRAQRTGQSAMAGAPFGPPAMPGQGDQAGNRPPPSAPSAPHPSSQPTPTKHRNSGTEATGPDHGGRP